MNTFKSCIPCVCTGSGRKRVCEEHNTKKHGERLKERVKEMRQKFGISGAAKKLNMNYSELHHIITQHK